MNRIDPRNKFNSHETDLYDSKYCSKEDEDCSLQPDICIREKVKMMKPLVVGYVFKSQKFSVNECFSRFQGVCKSRRTKQKFIFRPFCNDFLPS